MLAVVPPHAFGRLGAVLSALIVVSGLIGLTLHRDFYAGKPRRDFFIYYTNVSNLYVVVFFALVSPRLYASSVSPSRIAKAEFAVMMSIMLTFTVFHLILMPGLRQTFRQQPLNADKLILLADNLIIHYLVPWLVFLFWLLCSPAKNTLSLEDAFMWTLLPLAYLAYVFIRSVQGVCIEETDSPYPYPFLDIRHHGAANVAKIPAAKMLAKNILGHTEKLYMLVKAHRS